MSTTTTTATKPRTLLPSLPAEIRNQIYAYLSLPSTNTASTTNLPPITKIFKTAHTTLTLTPVHYGNHALLALRKYGFQEAEEYWTTLFTQGMGIEIRVALVFHGHMGTFGCGDWAKKVVGWMGKMVVKYGVLGKAKMWDVRILFDAHASESLRCKDGSVGKIAEAMTTTILQQIPTAGRGGVANIRLIVPWSLAATKLITGVQRKLGLETFLAGLEAGDGKMLVVREVLLWEPGVPLGLEPMVVGKETVRWGGIAAGVLVMRRVTVVGGGGEEWREVLRNGADREKHIKEVVFKSMRKECLEVAEARVLEGSFDNGWL